MKVITSFLLLILLLMSFTRSSSTTYPSAVNNAFQLGEKLTYRVTYGFMDAGEAVLELKSTTKKGMNRELLHAEARGRTLGGFNSFFKVNDLYETYLDKKGIFPWYFVRRVDEGGYKINEDYTFRHDRLKVQTAKGKEYKVPMAIQDMISSFYYARTLVTNTMPKGKVFDFKCFMDEEIWTLKIKYVGDEVISVRKGKFNCHKFVPVVQTGRYFKSEEDLNFWVTNDANKVPVLVKAKIPVGVVKLQLVDWAGLKNELKSKVK